MLLVVVSTESPDGLMALSQLEQLSAARNPFRKFSVNQRNLRRLLSPLEVFDSNRTVDDASKRRSEIHQRTPSNRQMRRHSPFDINDARLLTLYSFSTYELCDTASGKIRFFIKPKVHASATWWTGP